MRFKAVILDIRLTYDVCVWHELEQTDWAVIYFIGYLSVEILILLDRWTYSKLISRSPLHYFSTNGTLMMWSWNHLLKISAFDSVTDCFDFVIDLTCVAICKPSLPSYRLVWFVFLSNLLFFFFIRLTRLLNKAESLSVSSFKWWIFELHCV